MFQSVYGRRCISPDQSTCSKQCSSKISRHDNKYIRQLSAPDHFQDWLSGCPCRFTVIAHSLSSWISSKNICPAVMSCIPIFFSRLLQDLSCLLFRFYRINFCYKTGFFFNNLSHPASVYCLITFHLLLLFIFLIFAISYDIHLPMKLQDFLKFYFLKYELFIFSFI